MEKKTCYIRIDELLKPKDVAEIIQCSLGEVYSMAKTDLHRACVRIGGKVRFEPVLLKEIIRDSTGLKKPDEEHDFNKPFSPELDVDNIVKTAIASVKGSGYNQREKGKQAEIMPGKEV